MKIFDSHTHLNDDAFRDNVDAYIEHAHRLGVDKMAIVGSNTEMNQEAIELAHKYDNLYAIVGWHPEDSLKYDDEQEAILKEQLKDDKVVALGEIGLDYFQSVAPKKCQFHVFRRQIRIAKEMNMPISVHNREAFEDTYKILSEEGVNNGIIHSFNGDPEWLKKFIDLGMYVSYSGVASFKKTHEVHDSVRQTPIDKMLVETDAPYLAPEPLRGHQNEPGYTLYTVEAVARFRDTTPDKIADATYKNALKVFGLEK
ncbi:TatD family hydrolase [Apilactobacillus apisilvae]|uniref:TatD family hydrolase n=1 Tax=Apilactobacillus apisilvae TaxID=2923364 RepID=A0ABY4PH54_9LACO|nr:TatD family hydrolase [Apilactobacillus apisilvae]UQS84983.1 TatD family hydrolase [Apilactobacillus apisilvae]